MRIIGEIPHPACKITLFSWNSKYLVKLERGLIEQTFKIPEYEVSSDQDIQRLIAGDFLSQALQRFDEMEDSLMQAMEEL